MLINRAPAEECRNKGPPGSYKRQNYYLTHRAILDSYKEDINQTDDRLLIEHTTYTIVHQMKEFHFSPSIIIFDRLRVRKILNNFLWLI